MKLLCLGMGAVQSNVLAIIDKFFPSLDYNQVTILDKLDKTKEPIVRVALQRGATFIQETVTRTNYAVILAKVFGNGNGPVSPGVFFPEHLQVIDLTVGIDCTSVVEWCLDHGVSYINTALEMWDNDTEEPLSPNSEKESHFFQQQWLVELKAGREASGLELMHSRTLHARQHKMMNMADLKRSESQANLLKEEESTRPGALASPSRQMMRRKGASAVIDHGMNPGLVSHFTKAALERITDSVIIGATNGASPTSAATNPALETLIMARKTNNFAVMAQTLGLATIHISEKDSQVPKEEFARKEGEFLSTWSCGGFFEEGLDPTQVGWGSHEITLPKFAQRPLVGESNQIFIPVPGVDMRMKSFVPSFGEIVGYNIPHSEASTLPSFLTVWNETQDVALYRPTTHYVYHPPQCAIESWNDILKQPIGKRDIGVTRVLNGRELKEGRDAVGVLLIFHTDPVERILRGGGSPVGMPSKPWSYWAGTIVSVEENLRVSGEMSAPTTVQVAASVLSCIQWIMRNPDRGIIWPESLDHNEILEKANPYLGEVIFEHVEWDGCPEGLQFVDFMVSNETPKQ